MKVYFDGCYNARKSGGLFLGIRIHFPVTLSNDDNINLTWRNITLSVGLVIYTVNIHFDYARKYINFN